MNTQSQPNLFDVIIIGGGPAGLSAALVLGRSRKRVLVCDAGKPGNAVSHAARGFLSRDGIAPAELLKIGREQLRPYKSVEIQLGEVIDAKHLGDYFQITFNNGTQYVSRKILLATGISYILPNIEGLAPLWGSSVFHCPYCYGWEMRDQPLAIYGKGQIGFEFALALTGWSRDLILCSDGSADLSSEQLQELQQHKIQIFEDKIVKLESKDDVLTGIVFANGKVIPRRGIFLPTQKQQNTNLAAKLGCKLTSLGTVEVDENKQSSVPGLYVAGDASISPLSQVVIAAADGTTAAFFITYILTKENLVQEKK